jgi:3-keto-5-aminohexanoate cleavage enzyme
MRTDAAIIEVGLNEAVMRSANARVAYSAAECAADALRCVDAGAAVVHWHARDAETGAPRFGDANAYAEALALMRAGSDVLGYPTYPIDVPVEQRLDHVWELGQRHGLELAPIDIGSVTNVLWDETSRDFFGVDALGPAAVVDNPLSFTLDGLARAEELGMTPTLGAFDVGFTRTMVLLAESGRLRPPVFLKIFLAGRWAVGPFPSEAALDLHLAQIPDDLDVEWVAVPYALDDAATVERLCRYALERGGGIRVGIGDNPAAFPEVTNAELVERATTWCAESGRAVATPGEVRARFGITSR